MWRSLPWRASASEDEIVPDAEGAGPHPRGGSSEGDDRDYDCLNRGECPEQYPGKVERCFALRSMGLVLATPRQSCSSTQRTRYGRKLAISKGISHGALVVRWGIAARVWLISRCGVAVRVWLLSRVVGWMGYGRSRVAVRQLGCGSSRIG